MLGNEMSTLTERNLSLLHLFQAKSAFFKAGFLGEPTGNRKFS